MESSPSPAALACPVENLSAIAVTGADAADFLHGQLTSDVQALTPGAWQWAGYCNPKGRLLAVFRVLRRSSSFLLLCHGTVASTVHRRLAMFVLRADVSLADPVPPAAPVGLLMPPTTYGDPPGVASGRFEDTDGGMRLGLDPARLLAWGEPAAAVANAETGTASDWEAAAVRAGDPEVYAATEAAFLPQNLNLDRIGGVSFTKGCYPGQEIVARAHHLGRVDRRMRLYADDGWGPLGPGDSVYVGDRAAGRVVRTAETRQGRWLLAVTTAAHDTVAVGPNEPATVGQRPLPYSPDGD